MTAPIRSLGWATAVPDWRERIVEGRSLVPVLPLHSAYAEKALAIFKRLRVPDLPGHPTYGEVCGDWVFDFVSAVFGSYDPETRVRALQEFLLLVPKKNGKSAIAAAIMVTALILNDHPRTEMLLIAPTMTIAGISFAQAAGIIRLDEELLKLLHVQDHLKQITHRITLAVLSVKAASPDVVTGSKAAFVLIDELHEFALMSKADAVMIEIEGGLAARRDGFLLAISTQSKRPPAGVFRSTLARARAVRDGQMDYPMLPVIYELPPEIAAEGGWRDPATWGMVNPNLDRSVTSDFLAVQLQKAEAEGPAALALFASQHFNVEIGQSLHGDRWAGAIYWERAAEPGLTLEAIIDRIDVAVVGVDGGGLDDLFALAIIGRERETRGWLIWAHAWAQPEVLDRRKDIVARLQDFAAGGDLTLATDGTQVIAEACEIIWRLEEAGLLPVDSPAIGLDAAGIADLLDALEERGFPAERLTSVGQGWKLQPAVLTLPLRLKDGRVRHCGAPMMAWAVGNAKVELRGSNWIVSKETAGSAKIDPLIAVFNAAMLMFRSPQAPGTIDEMLSAPVMVL